MSEHYDVVVVGGAIVGSSVAYFLKHELGFAGSVLVVEKDPTYARSSTTLSAASIRQQFSTAENIRLSRFGVSFIKDLKARFGADADVGFREGGYLVLASAAGRAVLEQNHRVQAAEGADIVLIEPGALAERYPWMSLDDVALAAFGQTGEGWFDAHMLLDLIRKGARAAGATYTQGTVAGIEKTGAKVSAVTLADGRRIGCGVLVNAAGPAGGDVAALAGLALPVEPRKRCVFVVHCRTPLPDMPMLIDATGVYIRPEGEYHICGVSPAEDADPRADGDFDVDYALYEDVIWPALATRVPAMESLKLVRAWAGHYDYNTLDQNAVIGPHPDVSNFLFANGFSGHGLQQAPAAGRAVAELIVHGRFQSLDLTLFGWDRIARKEPVFELNVI
ncbi:NAD(P)/FAD-dependent oxidoreductase [Methyloraptor flagellatus]|uniref:FAD-binding oxidoreductase n=1 Tax=Methyloraptor flagellatus TaxID=3162530 RepID=A0AAU7XBG7_9HYPH